MAVKVARGLTLLELLVVVLIIAIGSTGVVLSLRDSSSAKLEREAIRLAALLDVARTHARTSGTVVIWRASKSINGTPTMQWNGWPEKKEPLPSHWLDEQTRVLGTNQLLLGPEPVMNPTRLRLQLLNEVREVQTDGIGSFEVVKTGVLP